MILSVLFGFLLVSVNDGIAEIEQRIAGGEISSISEYPFSAALLTNSGEGSYVQACGGTILTRTAVLSAASCFYTNLDAHPTNWWQARVGSTNSNSGGFIHFINRITVHPDFSPSTLENDIAVLKPTVPITFIPGSIEAARVAGEAYTFTLNSVVTAIGWGVTSTLASPSSELRKVNVFVINQQTCFNRYSEIGVTVTDNMICTGWLDVGVIGQCQGDSGSPILSINAQNQPIVLGVFSRAQGCAQGWYPAINTRLAPYLNWVVSVAYA